MKKLSVKLTMILFLFTLMMPALAFGQEKDKKDKKEDKKNQKDESRTEKQVRKYEEARLKAVKKYGEDADFREDVELEYKRIRRNHAKYAFEINTTDSDDEVMTNSGDKIPKDDTLYDNLLAQDYVNRVGQSLVPANSNKRYGFKITLEPMPSARSLSTGTIYISSGLLSMIDNEAQLAYALSHEIAHVEKEHWREDVMVAQYIQDQVKDQELKAGIAGAVAGGLFGAFGGKSAGNAISGAAFGASLSQFLVKLIDKKTFTWALAQEDEADKLAMEYMLNRNYDVREVQTFYQTLQTATNEDPRLALEEFADPDRSTERIKMVGGIIAATPSDRLGKTLVGASNLRGNYYGKDSTGKQLGIDRNTTVVLNRVAKNEAAMSDDIKAKLQNGEIMAGDGEFENIMATLKRDNGVIAFYYDMYALAERNLSESISIRSDDPLGYFYYGKVLKLTARKPGEKEKALQLFAKAISLDKRGAIPQSRLYVALTKMSGRTTNNIKEISNDLKQYVTLYQRMNGGAIPSNMDIIYDYMQQAGETDWSAVPVGNVKTVASSTTEQAVSTTSSVQQTQTTQTEATTPPVKKPARRP
jgi:hypothetical protein